MRKTSIRFKSITEFGTLLISLFALVVSGLSYYNTIQYNSLEIEQDRPIFFLSGMWMEENKDLEMTKIDADTTKICGTLRNTFKNQGQHPATEIEVHIKISKDTALTPTQSFKKRSTFRNSVRNICLVKMVK